MMLSRSHLRRRLVRQGLAAAAVLLLSPRPSPAQPAITAADWPTRSMRLIIPFPPGGATDLLARVLADRLGTRLGQTVVAENRGGAAGVIAAEAASRADPDGYTLFFGSIGTASINAHLHSKLSYRPEDLLPVALFADLPNVLVVRRDSPFRSVADVVAAARAKPGELTYASSGSGSSLHLSGEMLKADAGVDILHVPFRGGADTANQIIGGRIDLGMNNVPSVIALIRGGSSALAVTSPSGARRCEGADHRRERRPRPGRLRRDRLVRPAGPRGTPAPIIDR